MIKISIKNRGFTMIELIVVIAILGLLATVGLVSFRSAQIKGRDAQRKNDLSQIQKALELYHNDYGYYPTDDYPSSGSSFVDEKGTLYMKEMPQDPKFGGYPYSSDGTFYLLYARLENTQDPCFDSGLCKDYGVACNGENCNYAVASPNRMP